MLSLIIGGKKMNQNFEEQFTRTAYQHKKTGGWLMEYSDYTGHIQYDHTNLSGKAYPPDAATLFIDDTFKAIMTEFKDGDFDAFNVKVTLSFEKAE